MVQAILELPDKAEVIRFKDEEGVESDHIKMLGKLFRPDIGWMQYTTSEMGKEEYGLKFVGMGWESVDDETYETYFSDQEEMETWSLEEL